MVFIKKDTTIQSSKELTERLQKCNQKVDLFLNTIRALLYLIKDFSLDFEEINVEGFRKDIDVLSENLISEPSLNALDSLFKKYKNIILSFIERQKGYLHDRETEFKDIIAILTKSVSELNSRNQNFNQNIQKHSEEVAHIILLDDIKKIKGVLKEEVNRIKEITQKKELDDNKQMGKLSEKVHTLKLELKKAETKSLMDGLTGVYNRKAFDKQIKDLVERNTVTKQSFSMIFLDIDNFKNINDHCGHQVGDSVLLILVNKFKEFTRKEDLICRYGGDEFVIIMVGASLRAASARAKKIRHTISNAKYRFREKEVYKKLTLAVSIGVSTYKKGDTVATITERSDKALYLAKENGKNCVVSEKELKK